MLRKTGVLRFELGGKYDDIIIRNVQLWQDMPNDEDEPEVRILKGKFLHYLDLDKTPLWVSLGATKSSCFTTSSTTVAYFNSKLRRERRAIAVEITSTSTHEYIILYRSQLEVKCLEVDSTQKLLIDSQIEDLSIRGLPPVTATKDANIDVILRQSQERQVVNTKKIMNNLQFSERKLHFNETLSKLILGGLRLRAIPNSQSGFQKLYKMTFSAAEFAHRNELQQFARTNCLEIPFESLQATVETLLELFTKT